VVVSYVLCCRPGSPPTDSCFLLACPTHPHTHLLPPTTCNLHHGLVAAQTQRAKKASTVNASRLREMLPETKQKHKDKEAARDGVLAEIKELVKTLGGGEGA
jgi:ribosomal protein L15